MWVQAEPEFIYSGSRTHHKVAFTFDDGPKSQLSDELLDLLNSYHIKATFLVVGKECLFNPELLKRIAKEGHDVANHSYSHLRLDTLTNQQITLELSSTSQIIYELTGIKPIYFRPPGGRYNETVAQIAHEQGLAMLMWDVNTGDFSNFSLKKKNSPEEEKEAKAQRIYERVMQHVRNGSIILMHNGSIDTMRALPKMIEGLRERGFDIVPVSELLK